MERQLQTLVHVVNQNKGKLNLHHLQRIFKTRLTSKVLRNHQISNTRLIRDYQILQKRYQQQDNDLPSSGWVQNERKLFIWFSVIYCNSTAKNYDQLRAEDWKLFSEVFFDKPILALKYEAKEFQRSHERVKWGKEEEEMLRACVGEGMQGRWQAISKHIFMETEGECYKTSKQCREHWYNYMDCTKTKGNWTDSEDRLLMATVQEEGHKWAIVSQKLYFCRTEHDVKNRFNSLVSKQRKNIHYEIEQQDLIRNFLQRNQPVTPPPKQNKKIEVPVEKEQPVVKQQPEIEASKEEISANQQILRQPDQEREAPRMREGEECMGSSHGLVVPSFSPLGYWAQAYAIPAYQVAPVSSMLWHMPTQNYYLERGQMQ